jgi:hypothetical protein
MAALVRDPRHLSKTKLIWPENHFIHQLIVENERLRQNNEDTLAVKLKLHEENQSLRTSNEHLEATLNAVIEAAGEDWQDVDNLPNVVKAMADIVTNRQAAPASQQQQLLEQMIVDLRTLANPQNPTVPPMSPECFRQHAALTALNGVLAARSQWGSTIDEVVTNAVIAADALVQELAK